MGELWPCQDAPQWRTMADNNPVGRHLLLLHGMMSPAVRCNQLARRSSGNARQQRAPQLPAACTRTHTWSRRSAGSAASMTSSNCSRAVLARCSAALTVSTLTPGIKPEVMTVAVGTVTKIVQYCWNDNGMRASTPRNLNELHKQLSWPLRHLLRIHSAALQ